MTTKQDYHDVDDVVSHEQKQGDDDDGDDIDDVPIAGDHDDIMMGVRKGC